MNPNQILFELEQLNKFKYDKKANRIDAIATLHILAKIIKKPNVIFFNDNKFRIGYSEYFFDKDYEQLGLDKGSLREIKKLTIKIRTKMHNYLVKIDQGYYISDHDEEAYQLKLNEPEYQFIRDL